MSSGEKQLAAMANAIRFLSADAIEKSKSGHPGMPLGMADVAAVLFSKFIKLNPEAPRWFDRDRDRKSTRQNSSHWKQSRMPSSA